MDTPSTEMIEAITTKCHEHLEKEIELLEQLIHLSQAIHQHVGLQPNDSDTTEAAIRAKIDLSDLMGENRQQLRKEMAEVLRVPLSQATIRNLLLRLPAAQAERIEKQRSRLLKLERQVQDQNSTNSLLIRQTMDLYQKIASELSGTSSPSTYSPRGEMAQQNSPTMIQTDC